MEEVKTRPLKELIATPRNQQTCINCQNVIVSHHTDDQGWHWIHEHDGRQECYPIMASEIPPTNSKKVRYMSRLAHRGFDYPQVVYLVDEADDHWVFWLPTSWPHMPSWGQSRAFAKDGTASIEYL